MKPIVIVWEVVSVWIARTRSCRIMKSSAYQYRSSSIRRNSEKLRLGSFVAKFRNDCREEQRESVERHISTHIDDHSKPCLIVLDGQPNIFHLELFMLSRALLVLFQSPDHTSAILLGKKRCQIRKIVYEPDTCNSKQYSCNAFQNENPSPARAASQSVHVFDGSSEQPTERSGHRSGTEENRGSHTKFGSFVP